MNYRVWIRSKPGPYEQYDGYVDVHADGMDAATAAAFRKLKQGAFPDRTRDMWRVENVEPRHG